MYRYSLNNFVFRHRAPSCNFEKTLGRPPSAGIVIAPKNVFKFIIYTNNIGMPLFAARLAEMWSVNRTVQRKAKICL